MLEVYKVVKRGEDPGRSHFLDLAEAERARGGSGDHFVSTAWIDRLDRQVIRRPNGKAIRRGISRLCRADNGAILGWAKVEKRWIRVSRRSAGHWTPAGASSGD